MLEAQRISIRDAASWGRDIFLNNNLASSSQATQQLSNVGPGGTVSVTGKQNRFTTECLQTKLRGQQ